MTGTVWDSISLALSVALLVVALAALHTSRNWTQHKQRNATVTLNAKRERNSYTTPPTARKHSGSDKQPQYATYATNPSCLETRLKLITLMQETHTVNSKQHTEDATPAEVAPPYPSTPPTQGRQTAQQH